MNKRERKASNRRAIERLLTEGMGDAERPAEIRRLGAWWLEEVKAWTKVICQFPGESRIDICRSNPF